MFYETVPFVVAVSLLAMVIGVAFVRGVFAYRLRKRLASIRQREVLSIERARIARDIHDDVGARLTRISMLISLAAERTPMKRFNLLEKDQIFFV
jgi:signal transduction histidine kinase